MDAQKNKISENEFMSFCRLLEDEEGKTFSHLCDKFKRLLQEEPSWRSWIVRSGGFRPGSIIPEILRDVQWEEIGNAFQSMIERDGEAFDLDNVARLDSILFAAGFDDRVSCHSTKGRL